MEEPGMFLHAPPKAAALIEALRGLGYSTETALADIIDNSITARASEVHLAFRWSGANSDISILDNGVGMDAGQLEQAMRLGEKDPLDERASDDLGRFGLGLKTASFSQCRLLTVASRRDASTSCLRWDLDVLRESADDGWHLLIGPAPESMERLSLLNSARTGTLVLWGRLDRIVTQGFSEQDFLDLIDRVESHLAMVFHRYLEGVRPRLRIFINGEPLRAWDPFLRSHAATWSSPEIQQSHGAGVIRLQGHVLPHRDRLANLEYEEAAGPRGWAVQQGFYVYRNERLLVAGSWLGLGNGRGWLQGEAHSLARIRVDLPNSVDADWKIDIRKSTARPPVLMRHVLTALAESVRQRAGRVHAHRQQPVNSPEHAEIVQAWRADHRKDGVQYRIDESHPAVRTVLDEAGLLLPQVRAMLRAIEETVPLQRIWLDEGKKNEAPQASSQDGSAEDIRSVLEVIYRGMIRRKGMSPTAARASLLRTDPFNSFPDLIAALPDEPVHGG
jgi:hypothetical protein